MLCTNTKKKEKKKEIMNEVQYIYVKSDNADNAVSELVYSELMKWVIFNVFPLKQRFNEYLQSFCQIVTHH